MRDRLIELIYDAKFGENGIASLANMIIVGKLLNVLEDFKEESVRAALGKVVSARKANMFDANLKAMQIGAECK